VSGRADVLDQRAAFARRSCAIPQGTVDGWRRWLAMEKMSYLVENAFMIAWDYLDATGELGEPESAARDLLDLIEEMVLRGERRRILLANVAIDLYKRKRLRGGASDGRSDRAGAA
jgi:hypothetical protein